MSFLVCITPSATDYSRQNMRPAQGPFHHISCILSPSEWNIIYLFYTEMGKRNLLPILLPGAIFPGQGDMYKQGTGNKGKGPAGPCREVARPAVSPSVTEMSGGRGICPEVVAILVDFAFPVILREQYS